MRTLIGHEYEVRVEDWDQGTIDGWFRAQYLTPNAREMGWLWEIDDPEFRRLGIDEVRIVEVRPCSNAPHQGRAIASRPECGCSQEGRK